MVRKSKIVRFENGAGELLAGIIDLPPESIRSFALMTHCFTCSKDLKALVRISRALAARGFAVLRFDFTGLGNSQGDFLESNFSTNCRDIRAAVDFLTREYEAPRLLMGHSLGGTALLNSVSAIDSARALVTLATPGDTLHLANYLLRVQPGIASDGEGDVTIGGITYRLRKQLIDDLQAQNVPAAVRQLDCPLLVLHPGEDEMLPLEKGVELFQNAGSAKSLVAIDGADHLLINQPKDIGFVAEMIDTWATRYLADANTV